MRPFSSPRLASLDILRGFVLFMLVGFQPVLWAIGRNIDTPLMQDILYQFSHEDWIGFRVWDMVMPMFLFMSGASIPFAFSKYISGQSPKREAYLKILRRFIILFILGMIVQGNLLGLDYKHIYFYSNTLQSIACGYVIASIAQLNLPRKGQIAQVIALLVIYWIPVTFCGDYTKDGNFCEWLDRIILGRFRDGVDWDEAGQWHFADSYRYTWFWSSLTFGVTVLLGSIAGDLIKKSTDKIITARNLSLIGISLLVIAYAWSFNMPIIKKIWTSTMALWAAGFSYLLLALFYYVIDCKGHSHGLNWLKYYGMNCIVGYMLGEVVNFRSIVESLCHGLKQYLGDFYPALLTFGNFFIVFLILRLLYKHKMFFRV